MDSSRIMTTTTTTVKSFITIRIYLVKHKERMLYLNLAFHCLMCLLVLSIKVPSFKGIETLEKITKATDMYLLYGFHFNEYVIQQYTLQCVQCAPWLCHSIYALGIEPFKQLYIYFIGWVFVCVLIADIYFPLWMCVQTTARIRNEGKNEKKTTYS